MKKTMLLLFMLLFVCVSLFAVKYVEGKTLGIYPDTVISGNKFGFQVDPKTESAFVIQDGFADILVVNGDKIGAYYVPINPDGSVDYLSICYLFYYNTEIYMILGGEGDDILAKEIFSSISGTDFYARLASIATSEYVVGQTGPAGGIVFYDKGAYSDGWRYLEVAPADLRVVSGTPSVDKSDIWYEFGEDKIVFGYYKKSFSGKNLYVNGKEKYDKKDCTGTAIGTGEKNTELLVSAMGTTVYLDESSFDRTLAYAAKLCSDLVYNEFDDWFLPSIDELNLMVRNLGLDGYYWSSSESSDGADRVWSVSKNGANVFLGEDLRRWGFRVRAVRAF